MKHTRKNKSVRFYGRSKRPRWDRTCGNHGSCAYCRMNREFREKRQKRNSDWK